jgi:hypothetical protein
MSTAIAVPIQNPAISLDSALRHFLYREAYSEGNMCF